MTDWQRTDRGWVKRYGPPPDPVARSHLSCPMIATDTMDPTAHVDGNLYTSKSQFRALTKARGYAEIGDDPNRLKQPPKLKPDKAAIKNAVAKAFAQIQ